MIAEFFIREARESDANAISEVLLASIRDLCARDHDGAEAALQQWLANKTPQNIRRWLRNRDNIILVAECDGEIVSVGGLQTSGTVTLNYVAPAFRFQGVSKAMMGALERRAQQLDLPMLTLESTQTAHEFYLGLGYTDAGEAGARHGLSNFPMRKSIG